MSVTHGQCDAKPTVTFPAARHHRPLAGTKLYCLVTCVLKTCPELHSIAERPGFELATYWSQAQPLSHRSTVWPWPNSAKLHMRQGRYLRSQQRYHYKKAGPRSSPEVWEPYVLHHCCAGYTGCQLPDA